MQTEPTLADLVTAAPATARVLERHHLDYCCGGGQSLRTACAAAGVDPDSVLAEIDALAAGPEADWTSLSPTELVDHIESTHHAYLHEEMGRLSALAAKVLAVHGERHPELVGVAETYAALRADLEPHLAKEERVLFPMIRELDAAATPPSVPRASVADPIRVMVREHDRAGELLARLRTLTNGFAPPADACASYRALYVALEELEADTHLHVHKENNVLFPAVLGPGEGPATS